MAMQITTSYFTAQDIDLTKDTDRTIGYHGKKRFPQGHVNMHYGQTNHVVSGMNDHFVGDDKFATTYNTYHKTNDSQDFSEQKKCNPKTIF